MSAINPDHWAGCDCSQCAYDEAMARRRATPSSSPAGPTPEPICVDCGHRMVNALHPVGYVACMNKACPKFLVACAPPVVPPVSDETSSSHSRTRDKPGSRRSAPNQPQGLVPSREATGDELAPGTVEAEAMLRRHMAMYDWTKREAVAINDFILTIREGVAEDLARLSTTTPATETR